MFHAKMESNQISYSQFRKNISVGLGWYISPVFSKYKDIFIYKYGCVKYNGQLMFPMSDVLSYSDVNFYQF